MHSSSSDKSFTFFFCTMSFTEVAVMVLQDDDVDYTLLLNILKEKLKRKPSVAYAYHLSVLFIKQ